MGRLECSNRRCESHDPKGDGPAFKLEVEVDADGAVREDLRKEEPEHFLCVYCLSPATDPSEGAEALAREEAAQLAGMAHGTAGYNEAMGWDTTAPEPCGHHCLFTGCRRCTTD